MFHDDIETAAAKRRVSPCPHPLLDLLCQRRLGDEGIFGRARGGHVALCFLRRLGDVPRSGALQLVPACKNRATNTDLTSETDGLGVNRREILGDGVGAHVV